MNGLFTILKRDVVICGTKIKIRYKGEIKTQSNYDCVVVSTMKYLTTEGFLDDHPILENFRVFDNQEYRILRENCTY